ncbi:hypothetical protein HLB44_24640 [Aquincola sp. S2]|uniref:Uncharacterized protein n=1 Tax=Pseudaquabacterium terrae TaxID=2732868 RepID=A0ABX2ENC4_9BURK|nr:hypothetical protein [Aquabacterium terrae]NRF70200.1 hypothetical protein [Aquabacterium terrae]
MTPLPRSTTEARQDAAAEDAFTSEGGSPPPEELERERQMAEFRIDHDGIRYRYHGYQYDRFADAVAYARLMRSRPAQLDGGGPHLTARTFLPPTDAQRSLLAALDIRYDAGTYRFEEFRYDRMADAVSYAKLAPRRQGGEGS